MSFPLQIVPGRGAGGNVPEYDLTDVTTSREEAISADERLQIEQGDFLYCEPIRLEWVNSQIGATATSALSVTSGAGSYGPSQEMNWMVPFRGYEKYIQFRCNVKQNHIIDAGNTSKMKISITASTSYGDAPDVQWFEETDSSKLEAGDFVHLGNYEIPDAWLSNVPEDGGDNDILIEIAIYAYSSAAAARIDLYAPTGFVIRTAYSR